MNALALSWRRAWSGLNVAGDGSDTYQRLRDAYSEPHRKYHTLQHLTECVETLSSAIELPQHASEVEVALWFHDAVYNPKRSDNEGRSAEWARVALTSAGASLESVQRVTRLVEVTKHDDQPMTLDEQVLLDIDLSILGASDARFSEFERQVREEYSFVPGFLFRMKRKGILRTFLDRAHIYNTPHFRALLEQQARRNLERVISGRVAEQTHGARRDG